MEDDTTISKLMSKHIESWNYEVKCVENFKNILADFIEFSPMLVLMDISLPFFNGYHWCSEIRKISKVPIIFISSASDNMNIIMAVNMGGDDFIAKPFDFEILIAKIQAILRRTYDFSNNTNLLEHRNAIFDLNNSTVMYEDKKIELTKNEHKILKKLLENKGKIISRDTLMLALWETDNFVDDNTLSVNINRLRKKLENIGLYNFIATKKGTGYIIL